MLALLSNRRDSQVKIKSSAESTACFYLDLFIFIIFLFLQEGVEPAAVTISAELVNNNSFAGLAVAEVRKMLIV
jgi:hypothetical protein